MSEMIKKSWRKVLLLVFVFGCGMLFDKCYNINRLEAIFESYNGVLECANVILTLLSLMSIILLYRQIKGEHEKARREKAIELLLAWTNGITCETNAVKKIVEKLDENQCRNLFLEEKFKVSCSVYDEIIEAINDQSIKPKKCDECGKNKQDECDENMKNECNEMLTLNKRQIKKLRWNIISYLNLVEAILVSWQYSVADREIIEQQFAFLVSPKEGKNILEEFRVAAGSEDAYPAIEIFCNHMETERKKKLKEKGNIF